jgi:hypothetical protein
MRLLLDDEERGILRELLVTAPARLFSVREQRMIGVLIERLDAAALAAATPDRRSRFSRTSPGTGQRKSDV